jgi:hypothetical protein
MGSHTIRAIVDKTLREELAAGRLAILGRRKRMARAYHLLRAEGVKRTKAWRMTRGVRLAARRLRRAQPDLKERELATAVDLILV